MNDSYTEEYESLVAALASEYNRKYPMVERVDIAQTLWLWFVTHPVKFKEWSTLEPKDKEKLIAKSSKRILYINDCTSTFSCPVESTPTNLTGICFNP